MPRKRTPFDELFPDAELKERERREEESWLLGLFHPAFQRPPSPPFLIENFLPEGYLVIVAADPKVGKSCLARTYGGDISRAPEISNRTE